MKRRLSDSGPKGARQKITARLSFAVGQALRLRVVASTLLVVWITATTAFAEESPWSVEPNRLGLLKPASSLIGRQVGDRKERAIGKIEDLLLDLPNGNVLVTLISSSREAQLTPVPAQSYTLVSGSKLVVGAEKKTIQSAPHLQRIISSKQFTTTSLKDSFVYFRQDLPKASNSTSRKLCSAACLLGAQIFGEKNERLGQLKEIMVDLARGKIIYLVIQPTGARSGNDLFVAPPVSARLAAEGTALVLTSDLSHFLAGPHFANEFWTDMAFPEMATAVCNHYGLPPVAAAQRSPFQVGAEFSAGATRVPLVDERGDGEITQAVLEEIIQPRNGFVNLDIVVTTDHGRVTLAGIVKDEVQKYRVVAAVERVAGPGKVEDRLETQPKSRTARL
jgi:sporulation protein YlmC with PRC-barrel domain